MAAACEPSVSTKMALDVANSKRLLTAGFSSDGSRRTALSTVATRMSMSLVNPRNLFVLTPESTSREESTPVREPPTPAIASTP
eukprot:scaffold2119_cov67-Phaeocystis_antarctica.AAC.2